MDSLDEQLAKLKLNNSYPPSSRIYPNSPNKLTQSSAITTGGDALKDVSSKKIGPAVPPKPNKKCSNFPEVPQSIVRQTCEPLYSKRLQCDSIIKGPIGKKPEVGSSGPPILHRKQTNSSYNLYSNNKVTLDNPDILDQQLEALEHHKKQLQMNGILENTKIPKLSSASFLSGVDCSSQENFYSYSNAKPVSALSSAQYFSRPKGNEELEVYSNISHKQSLNGSNKSGNFVYSNIHYENNVDDIPPPPPLEISSALRITHPVECNITEDDIPPPPSPVSSSYSELRRATEIFPKLPSYPVSAYEVDPSAKICNKYEDNVSENTSVEPTRLMSTNQEQAYMNMAYQNNEYTAYESPNSQYSFTQSSSDYYGYGSSSQGSSTYESIYEPINPRPPSQISSRSNYLPYTSYVDSSHVSEEDTIEADGVGKNIGTSLNSSTGKLQDSKENEVEALTNLLVHSMDAGNDSDSFGICIACNQGVVGENSGCTAMGRVYHILCFTCSQCQINLQGKPFYALEGKPYCEMDYLNTLEKCSVCMKPILERILRATGKPYHPQCFTCVVCGNSLDGIPFTVDATNQNYCIGDFHKKFAPRCCVCKLPIMPEHGQEETVRVVALDRSFHFECYKCEDCGLLLSSEAEGRGCYPLDDHVLCKSCNAKRVQMLTNRMTTEL